MSDHISATLSVRNSLTDKVVSQEAHVTELVQLELEAREDDGAA